MLKKLIIINGPMGIGKTTTCRELHQQLDNAIWLDGDWCWQMKPWIFNEENKRMVIDNITYLLKNFLRNSSFDYIIFSWVIHLPEIFELILEKLHDFEFNLVKITLICSENSLEARMIADQRPKAGITESLQRLKLYEAMDTIKIDTTNLPLCQVVGKLKEIIINAV